MSEHRSETFTFIDIEGHKTEITTKKYTFNLEKILTNRFGEKALDEYNRTGKLECNISLEAVKCDFPELLELGEKRIDWSVQDYDELMQVYLFFIRFKKNAMLRAYRLDQEMIVSDLGIMSRLLNSLPKDILKKIHSGNSAPT